MAINLKFKYIKVHHNVVGRAILDFSTYYWYP